MENKRNDKLYIPRKVVLEAVGECLDHHMDNEENWGNRSAYAYWDEATRHIGFFNFIDVVNNITKRKEFKDIKSKYTIEEIYIYVIKSFMTDDNFIVLDECDYEYVPIKAGDIEDECELYALFEIPNQPGHIKWSLSDIVRSKFYIISEYYIIKPNTRKITDNDRSSSYKYNKILTKLMNRGYGDGVDIKKPDLITIEDIENVIEEYHDNWMLIHDESELFTIKDIATEIIEMKDLEVDDDTRLQCYDDIVKKISNMVDDDHIDCDGYELIPYKIKNDHGGVNVILIPFDASEPDDIFSQKCPIISEHDYIKLRKDLENE